MHLPNLRLHTLLVRFHRKYHPFVVYKGIPGQVFLIFFPPATKLRQGNVFTPVCQSFCSQRGWADPPGVGQTPPLDADPPWMQTPRVGRPPQMQTPTPLDADPPWVGLTPGGWADPPGWTDPPGCRPPLGWGPSPRYGQQADGMHSTGMHTCYEEFFELELR